MFKTPCTLRRLIGDPDETFAYRTSRTLVIKDWRIGLSLLFLQFVVFIYIVVYQIYFTQVYLQISDLVSTVRLNPRGPTSAYMWTNGQAPFCLNATNPQHPSEILQSYYTVDTSNRTYSYVGPGGSPSIKFQQRVCTYMDEANAVPLFEDERNFFITEVCELVQTYSAVPAVPNSTCNTLQDLGCSWQPPNVNFSASATRSYVPDVEFYTIMIDREWSTLFTCSLPSSFFLPFTVFTLSPPPRQHERPPSPNSSNCTSNDWFPA